MADGVPFGSMRPLLDILLHSAGAAEEDEPPPECDQGASFVCEAVYDWTDGNEALARLAEQDAKIDGNFRVLFWMIGIVQAFVMLPYLERLI